MQPDSQNVAFEPQNRLLAVHRQWAIWAFRRFRFLFPELTQNLYGDNWSHTIVISDFEGENFEQFKTEFHDKYRPITLDLVLSQTIPAAGKLIKMESDYLSEIWLNGAPHSSFDFNDLLSLAAPSVPLGDLDFDNNKNCWIFNTAQELTKEQIQNLEQAANQIGLTGTLEIQKFSPLPTNKDFASTSKLYPELNLATTRRLKRGGLRESLVQQDEDNWRQFLRQRVNQTIIEDDSILNTDFSCLYDPVHCGDSRLSELLTIYDRVNILLSLDSEDWLTKHQLTPTDIQELVRLNKVRLVFPYSITSYTSNLIETVAEVDRSALILSRDLAVKTIIKGQRKQPLIYAPLTADQRAALLSALYRTASNNTYKTLIKSYGEIFSSQHDMYMLRGAVATIGLGVGAYLGDVFRKLRNVDASLELMTCGAGVEWAMALNSSYIPRNFHGYDETNNSYIVASFLGRTKAPNANPIANRIHTITDGLLALSDVPPLDVAKNLQSSQVTMFRQLAKKLMLDTLDKSELQTAIHQINADVKAFESNTNRISKWQFGTLASGLAGIPIGDKLQELGPLASPLTAWIYHILMSKMPDKYLNEIEFAKNMMLGLATGSTVDTVIVSRTRDAISKNRK